MLEVEGVMYSVAVFDLLTSPSNKHVVVHVRLYG
jgi:hypothetical protein